MSYDLIFWTQPADFGDSAASVFERLGETSVPGLVALPIDALLGDLLLAFPGAVREPNGDTEWVDWVRSDGQASFQATWSDQHLEVACRHLTGDEMNRIIDVAVTFGCRFFDPQTGERFDTQ